MTPELHLVLTLQQLDALAKTLGIATSNLSNKSRSARHDIADLAQEELAVLLQIQQQVVGLQVEASTIGV
jgi:hypothetical protein